MTFISDLRFGLRLWAKRPGSFLSAVVALTLGIGLVTFSLCAINCVFFGKLPFHNPDDLVYTTIPNWAFRDFEEHQTTFEGLSAFSTTSANFKAADAPSRRRTCLTAPNFLDVVGVQPLFGRAFLPNDSKPGAEPVALLGYDLWQREFHGDCAALGSVIKLDGQPRTIVGIMPKGFRFPIDDELWLPADPVTMQGWGFTFGRLKPSVSISQARAELNTIAARLAASQSPQMKPSPIKVGLFTRYLSGLKGPHGPGPSIFAMLFLTFLVLFIACANVAGLTFANAVKRGTELAVRGALGASRARLISQMLVESSIISVCGALGGLLIVSGLAKWMQGYIERDSEFAQMPFWMHIQIDGRLLLGLIGLTFLANLLAGLWPALQATKRDINDLLKAQSSGSSGVRIGKFQRALVMTQIACSVVILTQAILLLGFSQRVRRVSLPFDPATILTARVDLPESVEPRSFFDELKRDLGSLPGVRAVTLSTSDPVSGYRMKPISLEGISYLRPEDHPSAGSGVVSTGFFEALNLPVLQGRTFTDADTVGSMPVAIVNATFAKLFLPPENPLGARFREGTNEWVTVVGCVADLNYDPSEEQRPVYFRPLHQQPARSLVINLHLVGQAIDGTKTLRAAVARALPDLAIYRVATIKALMDRDTMGYYLANVLLAICGIGALFLAILGIVGLITLSVSQRTREIGIRMALGAPRGQIVAALLKQVARQIAAGLGLGFLIAYALMQVLTHAVAKYPTATYPSMVYFTAVAVLGAISLVAVLVPTLRGAKVAPMDALRYE
jgi:putative ABC transport system permease protein